MKEKQVQLNFQKDLTRLAGFPYGESVFKTQVEQHIHNETRFTLVFPEHIEKIASSFVQGFFSVIKSQLGLSGIKKNVSIVTRSEKLTRSIIDNLL